MLFAFIDDSATHKGAAITCLCGFIAEEREWETFAGEWRKVFSKPGWPTIVKKFHMVDCVHAYGEFQQWGYADRLSLYGELVDVLVRTNIRAVAAAMVNQHLLGLSSADIELLKPQRMAVPLDFIFQHIIQQIIHRAEDSYVNEHVGVVFENSGDVLEVRFHQLYNAYKAEFYKGNLLEGGLGFGSKEMPPLQAADLLAYGTYQLAMANNFVREAEPWFPVVPAFERMLQGIANSGGIYDSEALARLLNRIKSGDRSIIGRVRNT